MPKVYGLMAEFEEPDQLLRAAREARRQGYRNMDAYSPFPVEGLDKALGLGYSRVPFLFLAAGVLGGIGAFLLQYYIAKYDYPINVGGRPLNSWPAFVPIMFELTVLSAGVLGFIGMLILNRLPMPNHPVFNNPSFAARASCDRFYICIEANGSGFDRESVRAFLAQLSPVEVYDLEED